MRIDFDGSNVAILRLSINKHGNSCVLKFLSLFLFSFPLRAALLTFEPAFVCGTSTRTDFENYGDVFH